MDTFFVDVILPIHIPDTLTYRVPRDYNDAIAVGQRVVVQVGAKKLYSAVVRRVHNQVPNFTTKYILAIIDEKPIVGEKQLQLWEWMANYYMCYVGDVMAAALPNALKMASESIIAMHPDFTGVLEDLTQHELHIVNMLNEHTTMTVSDISKALGLSNIMPILHGMIERQIIMMDEDLKQRFAPRTALFIALTSEYKDGERLRSLMESLEKKNSSRKQLDVLLKYLQLSHFGKDEIQKRQITECKELSTASLNTLIKNGILQQEERVVSRLENYDKGQLVSTDSIVLNYEQQQAYNTISNDTHAVTLLHGVTSSGKTEVYLKLIADQLAQGRQTLFLLPEIALTAQFINRLRRYFGNSVGVYHSRFSPSQRAEVWHRTIRDDEHGYNVLVGARSALFLPFHNLGLVVVDEEHDPSYKQNDPTPRYQGRDSAIYLAHIWGAHTVLGSATPSIETYYSAMNGKFGFTQMTKRYGGLRLPEVMCADMKKATKQKETHGYFSKFLIEHIQQALDDNQQVILFQNRRGFSLRIECDDCHWTPQCQNCDVSLVYHKNTNSLRCHYCGYTISLPTECPNCHSHHLSTKGFGTERIEEDLALLFPKATVARMDLDSTLQKNRYAEILADFEDHKIDILVGTQMVTKGLDFNNVSIVGILSADNLIHFPDYRAYERAFQLMMQVSGRAGRHDNNGKVIIQSFDPYHQAIRDVIDHDYQRMFNSQIQERRVFRYPPFYRLIEITLRHRDSETLNKAAADTAAKLRATFGGRVLGPEYPSIPRIRNLYIKQILMRFERNEALSKSKEIVFSVLDHVTHDKQYGHLMVSIDVDPS